MVKDVWTCSLYLMWRVCTRTIREENCIVNQQNISGKNFGFHSFTDSERVVCDHIYIFAHHHHHHQCHQQLNDHIYIFAHYHHHDQCHQQLCDHIYIFAHYHHRHQCHQQLLKDDWLFNFLEGRRVKIKSVSTLLHDLISGSGFTTDKRGRIIVVCFLIFRFLDSRLGRQKILHWVVAGTYWIQSAFNFFMKTILM